MRKIFFIKLSMCLIIFQDVKAAAEAGEERIPYMEAVSMARGQARNTFDDHSARFAHRFRRWQELSNHRQKYEVRKRADLEEDYIPLESSEVTKEEMRYAQEMVEDWIRDCVDMIRTGRRCK